MNRTAYALLALLLGQLVIVGQMHWSERVSALAVKSVSLADTGPFLIDEIHVVDGHGEETVLARQGDRWLLPGLGKLPADSARIEDLVQQLTQTDPGWSVAHTLPARQRFQVASYHFRRRIDLMAQGQKISSVYLGTSPGFRKVHARNEEQDDVYSISLNLFDTSTRPDQWLDRKILQVRTPLTITSDSYQLSRNGGEWRSGNGAAPDRRELDALLGALRNLQVEGVANEEAMDELAFAEAALILQVEGLAGTTRLELYTLADKYYIISSEFALPFKLSGYSFDQLIGIDSRLLSGAQ